MKINSTLLWILLTALVLRILPLNQSLWLDEAINVTNARDRGVVDLITNYAQGDFHPPLFHPLLHYWIMFAGDSEIAVRLPSLLAGLITIVFTFLISRLLLKPKNITINHISVNLQYLPAILLATSGLHIYYTTEARMYSMAAMFTSITFYFFIHLNQKYNLKPITNGFKKNIYFNHHFLKTPATYFFFLFLSLTLLTDYLPWFLLPLFFLYLPVVTGVAFLLTFPWWPFLVTQLHTGLSTASAHPAWSQVVGHFSVKNLALIPIKFTIGRVSLDNPTLYFLAMSIPLVIIGFLLFTVVKTWIKHPKGLSIMLGWIFTPIVLSAIISLKISVLSYFRFIFVLPAFYLVITQGITLLKTRAVDIIVTLLIVTNLISSTAFIFLPQFHKENWRDLSLWIDSYPTDSAITIFPNLAQSAPYLYYQKRILPVSSIREQPDLPEVVFLMRYVQDIFDPEDAKRQDLEALGYQLVEQRNFNGVSVWAYLLKTKLLATSFLMTP